MLSIPFMEFRARALRIRSTFYVGALSIPFMEFLMHAYASLCPFQSLRPFNSIYGIPGATITDLVSILGMSSLSIPFMEFIVRGTWVVIDSLEPIPLSIPFMEFFRGHQLLQRVQAKLYFQFHLWNS